MYDHMSCDCEVFNVYIAFIKYDALFFLTQSPLSVVLSMASDDCKSHHKINKKRIINSSTAGFNEIESLNGLRCA